MVVSDRGDGERDLFERSDAYYIYLRDPRLTEDAVREANGWAAKAAVPLWIAMPAHRPSPCEDRGHADQPSAVAASCRGVVLVDAADPPAYGDGREIRPTGTVPEGIVPSRAQLPLAAAGLEPATPGL